MGRPRRALGAAAEPVQRVALRHLRRRHLPVVVHRRPRDGTAPARVLVHELGHALGIGHVENPDSIMYSYSIGETLTLSEEDLAALKEVCAF